MKKFISLSLVLVAVSLLGFVVLQVSWVINLVETQRHRIITDVERAAEDVANDLAKSQNNGPLVRPQRQQGLRFPDNSSFNLPLPTLVNEHYTLQEVTAKLETALEKHDAKNVKVEFAIYYGQNAMEMRSPNFITVIQDTTQPNFSVPISTSDDFQLFNSYETLNVVLPDFQNQVWSSLRWSLFASGLFAIVIIMAFYVTVRIMLEQGRLSKSKTDFINNMTHEFKTPLATISLAIDALQNPKVQGNAEKTAYFSNIIKEENIRMNKHVETILQAASMEKQELKLSAKILHVHPIIQHITDAFTLQLEDKKGKAILHLNARKDTIMGDEIHFTSLINNLIDNAVKYSKEGIPPQIIISTSNAGNNLVIKVEDNGIGMSKDTIKHVFQRFYRAHTGNLHNVKGFGLGMSYVKSVVDAHKGKIKVDSALGKGTVFTVEIPLAAETDENQIS